MLEYKIDLSKEIDVNKTDGLYECIISLYWYFLEINSNFQPKVCNGRQDLMRRAFNDVAIVSVKEKDCRIHFWHMSKDEAINLLIGLDLTEKSGTL